MSLLFVNLFLARTRCTMTTTTHNSALNNSFMSGVLHEVAARARPRPIINDNHISGGATDREHPLEY